MGYRLVVFLLVALAVGACGKEIGDACVLATDCSPNGDRQCDSASLPDGYCTIQGCDWNTCPDEAVCVRFFTASFSTNPCDRDPDAPEEPGNVKTCALDELCALTARPGAADQATKVGLCAPRAAEVRYCMRKCDSDGDCRDGYECRTAALMARDGGETVRDPNASRVADDQLPKFCAVNPATVQQ